MHTGTCTACTPETQAACPECDGVGVFSHPDAECGERGCYCPRCGYGLAWHDNGCPDFVRQLGSGQFVLAADVEERGQLVIAEVAPDPVPAPLNHTPEHPADDLRRQQEA